MTSDEIRFDCQQRGDGGALVVLPHIDRAPLTDLIDSFEIAADATTRRPVVRPTEAGRVFVESARAILADSDRLIERTVLAGRGGLGTVRVGYIYSAVFETLPRLVAAMGEAHPGVTVDVCEGWSPELDAALLADTYDVALSRDLPQRPEYRSEPLRRERLVAVVADGHPLARQGHAGLREFAGQRFCHPPRRLAPDRYDFMSAALERTGETFTFWENPIHGLGHLDLQDGRSFALVSGRAAGRVPLGTTTVALTDDLPPLDLRMVWKRDNTSPALGLLISTAREVSHREGWLERI